MLEYGHSCQRVSALSGGGLIRVGYGKVLAFKEILMTLHMTLSESIEDSSKNSFSAHRRLIGELLI